VPPDTCITDEELEELDHFWALEDSVVLDEPAPTKLARHSDVLLLKLASVALLGGFVGLFIYRRHRAPTERTAAASATSEGVADYVPLAA